jgi:uncharacterized OB-fold protein
VTARIPVVGYLDLDGAPPHLVAQRCAWCGALFLDRRNGCGRCGGQEFEDRPLATTGALRSFTVVHRSGPSIPVPYVSVVVDLDGGGCVMGNLSGVAPDPAALRPGLRLRLSTAPAGTDDAGREAVSFHFEPA